jgi:hypothetical protein
MSVNFYEAKCQSTTREALFGLYDKEDKKPASIVHLQNDKWNATVINPSKKEIIHTAIDNCIEIFRENGEMDYRCDSMLTYPDNIIFVELKNKGSDWKSEGINQVEITIQNFTKNHNLSDIKHKRAFIANRKHPHFHVIMDEQAKKFWDIYKVRLNIDSEIRIK